MAINGNFELLCERQKKFQKMITSLDLPLDSTQWSSYHILAMVEELGELVKTDKRWKTHRNKFFNVEEKLDELADCFITLINIGLFSGFTAEQMYSAMYNKIEKNVKRKEKEKS